MLKLQYAVNRIKHTPAFKEIIEDIVGRNNNIDIGGVSGSKRAFWTAAVKSACETILCITYNSTNAREIYDELRNFYDDVYFFPAHQGVLYNVLAHSAEAEQKRIQIMDRMVQGKGGIIVLSVEALLFPVMPRQRFVENSFQLETGQAVRMQELTKKLIGAGYIREDMIEGPGQFSIRGGIVDIYPVGAKPYRLEFFGDEIESIRIMDISTQRSVGRIEKVAISPCRELLLEEREKDVFFRNIRQDMVDTKKGLHKKTLREDMEEIIELFETGNNSDIISNYWMYGCETTSLIDYLTGASVIVIDNPVRVKEYADSFYREFIVHYTDMIDKGRALNRQKEKIFTLEGIIEGLREVPKITFTEILTGRQRFGAGKSFNFSVKSMHPFYRKVELAVEEMHRLSKEGYLTAVFVSTRERGDMLAEELKNTGVFPLMYPDPSVGDIPGGQVIIDIGFIKEGFIYPEGKFAVFSDGDIFGTTRKKTRVVKKDDRDRIQVFSELSPGDYVVHETQGIGMYKGICELKVEGIKRDYLKIEYRGGDILYLPTYQSHLIQKYIGAEGRHLRLSKMGGREWAKTKAGVKKAIENMARELLELYAFRQSARGYSFGKDTPWQRQFEDLFPFQETPDQARCIEEVKGDMQKDRPMDRLLCGDVGYGKTEVAMRAAFKAVMDGKQVAMLVPTTILAQQHYNTFMTRMEQFPVNIEMISRFRSPDQQQEILKLLREGNIDIIIGTHRLLQEDVRYKNLGLLIVDEEQRFGVAHKEAIKKFKKNIDVLTLTATPIPRTLHMSLTGIRDMSIIQDPPEDRLPVETYVMEYNEGLIRDAVLREISRKGQVYFVHNRVKSILKFARDLKRIVPEASIGVAHGQMQENDLENVMIDFLNREYDVLVCTTIIETGLDIPNVNTIIVTEADKLGLSQMYQLRGRVGRSNRLAYAYFTYKKDKVLTEAAEKRLKAIKEFTEFGAGFKIALKDLEIRGTGNILGREQHGHMMMVGYDLYSKLLDQTVKELKGIEVEERIEPLLDLKVDAFIPGEYIQDEKQKVEIYRRIAAIESPEDFSDVEEEIKDRFGSVLPPVKNLLVMAYIRSLCQKAGITSIEQEANKIKARFKDQNSITPEAVAGILNIFSGKIKFQATETPSFIFTVKTENPYRLLLIVKGVLEKIIYFQQGQIAI